MNRNSWSMVFNRSAACRRRAEDRRSLRRLSPEDRALRFNSALVDDAQIARYVGQMRFGEDLVLGLVDAEGSIVGRRPRLCL